MRDYAPTCPACRVYGNAAKEGEAACLTCRVELMEENEEVANVYQATRGQVRTLGEQVIDIDHVALWQYIDRMKISDPIKIFRQVNNVFHHFLSKDMEKNAS